MICKIPHLLNGRNNAFSAVVYSLHVHTYSTSNSGRRKLYLLVRYIEYLAGLVKYVYTCTCTRTYMCTYLANTLIWHTRHFSLYSPSKKERKPQVYCDPLQIDGLRHLDPPKLSAYPCEHREFNNSWCVRDPSLPHVHFPTCLPTKRRGRVLWYFTDLSAAGWMAFGIWLLAQPYVALSSPCEWLLYSGVPSLACLACSF